MGRPGKRGIAAAPRTSNLRAQRRIYFSSLVSVYQGNDEGIERKRSGCIGIQGYRMGRPGKMAELGPIKKFKSRSGNVENDFFLWTCLTVGTQVIENR
jgi:hypothetical protein